MNNKLNYNILVELGKNLITGLFPYVFLNNVPKRAVYPNNFISGSENNSKTVPYCTKTKKKILYYHVPINKYWLNFVNNLDENKQYNSTVYFNINKKNNKKMKSFKKSKVSLNKKIITQNQKDFYESKTIKNTSVKSINFFEAKRFTNNYKNY